MSYLLNNISIIIPVAPDETAHEILLDDLKDTQAEIVISSEGSRAKSLNAGAVKAGREFLWFLHADSRVSSDNIIALKKSLEFAPDALHYFNLTFDNGGLLILNAFGANIRSKIFGLPYGDQGFCLSKTLFDKIGNYPENTQYGEDLLFIRRVKQAQIKLQNIPSKLRTSARKYENYGWGKLMLLRQWQLMMLLKRKS